jgi:glycosyltransferase involved in cell wall biosynthesis
MHIGFACHFKPALVESLLDAPSRALCRSAGGRANIPVANLIPALLRRGHRITVFSAEPSVRSPMELSGPGLTLILLPHRPSPLRTALDHFRRERAALAAAIRQIGPDLVHGHWTQNGHSLAALDSGLPALVTIHDAALTCEWLNRGYRPDRIVIGLQRLLMTRAVIRRSRRLVAVSPYVADHVKRVFRFSGDLHVIPNPLPFGDYAALRLARTRKCDPLRPVFADISGWGRLKNVTTLLKAFRIVRNRLPGARLLLFGMGLEESGRGSTWAARRGLAGGVEFRGALPHAELLNRLADEADALIHLSYAESFGMTLCEALALDIPVIASNTTGIPWTLQPLTDGLLHDVTHPEQAAAAMLKLAQRACPPPDPAVRTTLQGRFDSDVIAARLELLYLSMTGGPAA